MLKTTNGRLLSLFLAPKNYKPALSFKIVLSLTGMLLGIFLLPETAYLSTITPEKLIELTNAERLASGLSALSANERLAQAALAKGRAILAAQTFSHTLGEKKFSVWVRDAGYGYSYVGENLAIDFVSSEGVMAAWNDSAPHRQNLLSPYYKEIGLAAVAGDFQGQDTTVVVQIFGAPATAIAARPKPKISLNFSRPPLYAEEINLPLSQFGRTENFLTPSNLSRQTELYLKDKTALADDNLFISQVNKLVVRPQTYPLPGNFFIIFIAVSLSYLLILSPYHYSRKIKRLISA